METNEFLTSNRITMLPASTLLFPGDYCMLDQQLERIFNDPLFSEAEVLKKFLKYIVVETYYGRSNCLKEYTIAISALGKPTGFRPQDNCIVRIHAGRLRRALDMYYNGAGSNDELVIFIPKGKYVPEFSTKAQSISYSPSPHFIQEKSIESKRNRILGVIPFLCDENDRMTKFFRDGLCIHFSNSLMKLKGVDVISYQTISGMTSSIKDLRVFHKAVGCSHLISGGIQYLNYRVRITMQLFHAASGQQLFASVFERTVTSTNTLWVQDELVKEMNAAICEALTVLEQSE
jgi:TolB-like protein